MSKASRPHDEAVVELLREDPAFADEYLSACTEGLDQPGGREALLMALRQVAEAQGMAAVAERAAHRGSRQVLLQGSVSAVDRKAQGQLLDPDRDQRVA